MKMASVTGHFSHRPDCNATLSLKVEKKHGHYLWAWGFLVEASSKPRSTILLLNMIFNCFVDRSWSDIVVSVRGKPVTLQDREDNLLPGLQNQHHSMHNNIICVSIVLMPASSTFFI